MRKKLILITFLGLSLNSYSQSKLCVEQYYYKGKYMPFNFVPIIGYQTMNKWYVEGRFNYEAQNTASIYAGKVFENNGPFSYYVVPMLGIVAGRFKGGSVGANIELEYKSFGFSSQAQYTFSIVEGSRNFVYSWSDLTVNAFNWLSVGVSVQHTQTYRSASLFEKGILIKPKFKNWTLPFYVYNPDSKDRYFVVGLTYEMDFINPQTK